MSVVCTYSMWRHHIDHIQDTTVSHELNTTQSPSKCPALDQDSSEYYLYVWLRHWSITYSAKWWRSLGTECSLRTECYCNLSCWDCTGTSYILLPSEIHKAIWLLYVIFKGGGSVVYGLTESTHPVSVQHCIVSMHRFYAITIVSANQHFVLSRIL